MSPWTDERRAKLKHWWLELHLTSSQIAERFAKEERFTLTRNAVIGAVHRSEWWQGSPQRKTLPPRLPKPVKSRAPKIVPPPPEPVIHRRVTADEILPGTKFLSVVTIQLHQCRYWYGETRGVVGPRNQTGFCGRLADEIWCPEHSRLVYVGGQNDAPKTL